MNGRHPVYVALETPPRVPAAMPVRRQILSYASLAPCRLTGTGSAEPLVLRCTEADAAAMVAD